MFKTELAGGFPTKRSVDYASEVQKGSKPSHPPFHQLSSAEKNVDEEYIEDLLRNGKLKWSKSPYGALLSFVKENDNLRGVVVCCDLNKIKKRNNAPF